MMREPDRSSVTVFRVTTAEELRECLAIRREVFVEEQRVPPDLEEDECDASPEACRHFLLTADGTPAATGRWRAVDGDVAKMQRIAVRRPYRGMRFGRRLLEAMEQDAAGSGMRLARLDAQLSAEGFYRKLGYVRVSDDVFLEAGIEHVRMEKPLPPAW